MESPNTISIDSKGNILIKDEKHGQTQIPSNNENEIIYQLNKLNLPLIDGLLQIVDLNKNQVSDLFKTALINISKEKNIVKGNITNVNSVRIGDELHFHYTEAKLPKELTLNLPKTHPNDIIGREHDLEELHKLLNSEKRVVLVNGLGGLGKTTLAQAFLTKYYDEYQHIVWIGQNDNALTTDFINSKGLIDNLSIKTSALEPNQIFEEIIRKLKSIHDKPNLLVIDNAEESVKQYLTILPTQPQWHLIVTSRELITGLYLKPLGFLNEKQAIELFRKHYTHQKLNEHDIRELVLTVDYHTLTIEILAKSAEESRYDLAILKDAIKKDLRARIDKQYDNRLIESEKIGTYLSFIFNLSKLSEDEIWLMKQFACLPSEFHTYDLLEELLIDNERKHAEFLPETIAALSRKGWLIQDKKTDSYKMHRIIAETVRKQKKISITDVEYLLSLISDKLNIDQFQDNPVDKFIWIPFGTALLNNFSDGSYFEVSRLQNNLGVVFQNLGDFKSARPLLESAAISTEKEYGYDHVATAKSYSNLALLLKDLGDFDGAKPLLERSVVAAEKNYGKDHPDTATAYFNLSTLLQDLGDFRGAKLLMENVIAVDEKHYGEDHPYTALSYSKLGTILQDLGDFKDAKLLLEKALAIDEKTSGMRHPSTANSYSKLALVLIALGDFEYAKPLLEKALASNEMNFGKDHPNTATSYSNLSTMHERVGEFEGAKFLLEKSVATIEKHYGKDHPQTAISKSNLGIALANLGDLNGAKLLMERSVIINENSFGNNHPNTALSYSNLAMVLRDLGDLNGARALMDKAVTINENSFGNNHPKTATSYSYLGNILKELGDSEGAKVIMEKAVASNEKIYGQNHLSVALSYYNLGLVLKNLGDFKGAIVYMEKAIASSEMSIGKDYPNTRIIYSTLAIMLRDSGDFEGAKSLMEKTLILDEKNFGYDHPNTIRSCSSLVLILSDLGNFEDAKAYAERAISSNEKNLGKDHPETALSYSNLAFVFRSMGNLKSAKNILEQVIASNERNFGKAHPTTLNSYSNLAKVLSELGDSGGAKAL